MRERRWGYPLHKLAVIVLAGAVVFCAGAAAAAAEDPDWPCVQRLMPEISPATVWGGPPLDDAAPAWRETPAIRQGRNYSAGNPVS